MVRAVAIGVAGLFTPGLAIPTAITGAIHLQEIRDGKRRPAGRHAARLALLFGLASMVLWALLIWSMRPWRWW